MNAAVAAADGHEDVRGKARDLTREVLAARRPIASGDAIETTLEEAMRLVAGSPLTGVALDEEHAAAPVCSAWLALAAGHTKQAIELAGDVTTTLRIPGAEIETMALHFWAEAIERLAEGDVEDARRLWLRAVDFGANFGTETSSVIAWTYAASFRRG
jgi:hypothetical protein